MLSSVLFIVFMILMIMILIVMVVIGFLAGGLGSFLGGRSAKRDLQKLASAYPVTGVITDAQLVFDDSPMPYHYKYALQYTGQDGVSHRAFLGISTNMPLYYAVGQPAQLRLMQQPLMDVPPDAVDPMRGADGRLPGMIRFRIWNGVPVDETATVMLESDYTRLCSELSARQKKMGTLTWILLIIGGVFLLGLISMFTFTSAEGDSRQFAAVESPAQVQMLEERNLC